MFGALSLAAGAFHAGNKRKSANPVNVHGYELFSQTPCPAWFKSPLPVAFQSSALVEKRMLDWVHIVAVDLVPELRLLISFRWGDSGHALPGTISHRERSH